MRIIHLIRHDDPPLLRRHQELDASTLGSSHELETWFLRRDHVERGTPRETASLIDVLQQFQPALLHIYSSELPPNATIRALDLPWIAPSIPHDEWFGLRKAPVPDLVRSPHPALGGPDPLPEAVERALFTMAVAAETPVSVGGLVSDEPSRSFFDSVRARITRTRDDVRWMPFHERPSPAQLAEIGVWLDCGANADRADDLVPEALVAGKVVVAQRNALNSERLLGGEAGFLVPERDPNETAHVIVNALFKPEITEPRLLAARATRDRFDPSLRARAIDQAYEDVRTRRASTNGPTTSSGLK